MISFKGNRIIRCHTDSPGPGTSFHSYSVINPVASFRPKNIPFLGARRTSSTKSDQAQVPIPSRTQTHLMASGILVLK